VISAIPVTLLYGGLFIVLLTSLGSYISLRRLFMGPRARLGKPTPDELLHAVRAHGNAAEWVPLGIIGLLMLELRGAPPFWLHVLGGSLLAMRLGHTFYAFNKGPFWLATVVVTAQYGLFFWMGAWVLRLHFAG
jgi:uncharacterized membrane protein YecN with MAPEG domain